MTQTDRIIKAMLHGWKSTKDLIEASGSLTPLARLAEWRNDNCDYYFPREMNYPLATFTIHGKIYEEQTRQRKVLNRDGKAVQITERKFKRVS